MTALARPPPLLHWEIVLTLDRPDGNQVGRGLLARPCPSTTRPGKSKYTSIYIWGGTIKYLWNLAEFAPRSTDAPKDRKSRGLSFDDRQASLRIGNTLSGPAAVETAAFSLSSAVYGTLLCILCTSSILWGHVTGVWES